MALLPDFTISGEATPTWTETYPTGGAHTRVPNYQEEYNAAALRPPTVVTHYRDACWIKDTSRRRHGNNSIKVTSYGDGFDPSAGTTMGCYVSWHLGGTYRAFDGKFTMAEGDEEWVGWSWYWPTDYYGGASWLVIWEIGSGQNPPHGRYGSGFHAPTDRLYYLWQEGFIPQTGARRFTPKYSVTEPLLGTGAPRPFTKGVWHDFYSHRIYRARTNGVYELWHREEGGSFEKLYSNKNDGTALINRAPHPTWYWTGTGDSAGNFDGVSDYGSPGDASASYPNGTSPPGNMAYRIYRGGGSGDAGRVVQYWADGFFRRQSEQAIQNEFAANVNPAAPTITSFDPTSGAAGVTSVTITGTGFTGAAFLWFNGVSAAFSVNSDTQITTTVPSGATTGKIQVDTPNGTGISPTDFTVGVTTPIVLPDPALNHLRIGNSAESLYSGGGAVVDTKRVILRSVGAGNTITIDRGYFLTAGPISGGSSTMRLIVHDNDGLGGLPGSLLGVSDDVTVAQGAAAAWVPFPFSTPAIASGDLLYIGIHYGGPGSVNYNYQPATGQGWRRADTFVAGVPASTENPFGDPVVINIEPAVVMDYTLSGDTVAPLFSSANIAGDLLELVYDEPFDSESVPAPSDFTVTVNLVPWTIAEVTLSGTSVLLRLAATATAADIVRAAYTVGANPLRDSSLNVCANLPMTAVENRTGSIGSLRRIDPTSRVAVARRIAPADRRVGEGGGL